MEIVQLRTFLAVLEAGSFSRAAAALHIGQSTVSFHIKALETATAATLLDRRGGSVRCTSAGSELRRYALRIVALQAEALARLRAEEAGETGQITVAASTIPAEYLLPPLLGAFRRDHQGVAIVVDVSDTRRALAMLLAQECDLAVVGGRVRDRRVVSTAFADDEVVLIGPSPNRFGSGSRMSDAQIAAAPFILREEGSGTREVAQQWLAKRQGHGHGAATLQVGSTEAAKRCAREGLGLTFVSRCAVADEIKAGHVTLVQASDLPLRRRFHAARLKSVTPSTAARALWQLLVQKNR